MERLPPEVLRNVFIQLDLRQRLVCLLVCRTWWHLLDGGSLFYNVNLEENDDRFERMMNMFEHSPNYAFQVEELDIKVETDTLFNRRVLLNVFPNARVIRVTPDKVFIDSIYTSYPTPIDMHSKPRVEFLSDFSNCEIAVQVLYSKLGGRLKTLYLDFAYARRPSSKFDFSQLKGLPVLKKLSLKKSVMAIEDLEEIHRNIPSIEDFSLENVTICSSGPMPFEIIPATGITRLTFYYGEKVNESMHAQLYRYMAKKYINVTDIDYAAACLRDYSVDERRYLYMNGLLDFLQVIGPHQSKLTLCGVPDGIDPFGALDSVNCRIKELCLWKCDGGTLFQYLSQSKQSRHLEQLKIENTNTDSINSFKNLTNLTLLSIDTVDTEASLVRLSECLDVCSPSLKTLLINCYNLEVGPFKNSLDSIETLDIGFHNLPDSLGDIISSCFPNLVKLRLKGEVSENITITLKNPHFQEAIFSTTPFLFSNYPGYGFAFSSPNLTACYFYCRGRTLAPVEREKIQHLPILSVVSLTESRLILSDEIKVVSC